MRHPFIVGTHTGGIIAVCHRGANRFAPENTLAAAELCFSQGGHYLEIDVRETADHQIVVMHDETVDRTTNGSGRVDSLNWDDIRRLDAGAWFRSDFAGQTVPLLGDIIALCRREGRGLYIENKQVDPERLLRFVADLGFLEQCFFWSGNATLQQGMRRASPDANIKATRKHYASAQAMLEHIQPQLAEIDITQFARWAAPCIAMGVTPMLQYFGDDPEVFRQIVKMRPPMINLNRVDLLVAAAEELRHA